MGSARRLHRRARSAKVVYKDSFSEEEEDEDFSIAHQPVHTTRRNLALKRVSRSQEQAEVLQIQKAIEESLSQGKGNVNTARVFLDAVGANEVDDSEEEFPNVPNVTTDEADFQCPHAGPAQETSESTSQEEGVLHKPVIFGEISIPSMEIVHGDKELSEQELELPADSRDIKNKETISADKKISKAAVEKDENWSCDEENDDDDDDTADDVTEDESSDASIDSNRKRRRPGNVQQNGKKAVGHTTKDKKAFQVKKPRSSRAVPEARALLPAKRGLPSNGNGQIPKFADAKEESLTSMGPSKKQVMNSKECKEYGRRGVILDGCKTACVEPQKSQHAALFNKTSLLDSESSGILGIPAQSPTGLHRRVIGLSRRFKPPPLHPYLPKMDC